jgi:hypothetical protein
MNFQHKELAQGRWGRMPFCEQMANIGSEVSRALNWKKKDNKEYQEKAIIRALELLSLTIVSTKTLPYLKELTRVKEALLDHFYGNNEFMSSESLWRKYFDHFAYATKKNHDKLNCTNFNHHLIK